MCGRLLRIVLMSVVCVHMCVSHVCVHMCVCTCVCVHMCVCTCMCVHMCVHMCVYLLSTCIYLFHFSTTLSNACMSNNTSLFIYFT